MNELDDFDSVLMLPDTITELYLPPGRRDRSRPFLKGDPFQGGRCVLPKPAALVSLVSREPLSLVDRRVLNVLLAASWTQLMRGKLCEAVPTRDVRIATGLGAQRDNRRFLQSILRLRTVLVNLWPERSTNCVSGPLLAGCAPEPGTARLFVVWTRSWSRC